MIYHFKIWDDRTEALGKVFEGKPWETAASVIEEIASLGPIHAYKADTTVTLHGLNTTTFEVDTKEEILETSDSNYIEKRIVCERIYFPNNFIFTGSFDNINYFCTSFTGCLGEKLPRSLFKKQESENA